MKRTKSRDIAMLRGKAARDMVCSGCELVSYAEDICDSDIDSDDEK